MEIFVNEWEGLEVKLVFGVCRFWGFVDSMNSEANRVGGQVERDIEQVNVYRIITGRLKFVDCYCFC